MVCGGGRPPSEPAIGLNSRTQEVVSRWILLRFLNGPLTPSPLETLRLLHLSNAFEPPQKWKCKDHCEKLGQEAGTQAAYGSAVKQQPGNTKAGSKKAGSSRKGLPVSAAAGVGLSVGGVNPPMQQQLHPRPWGVTPPQRSSSSRNFFPDPVDHPQQ